MEKSIDTDRQDALGIWASPDGAAKVVFFADPDGIGLSLTQA